MSGLANMSPQALAAWQRLNEIWGRPIPISSSYRDPETNKRVGGAKGSQHLHGNAFDIPTSGMSPQEIDALIKAGVKAGFRGFGGYANSLHFDVGPQRTWGPDYGSGSTPEYLKSALAGANFSDMNYATPTSSSKPTAAASGTAGTMTALGKGGGTVTPDQIAQQAQMQSQGQQPEQPRGLLGNFFGDPDRMAALAMALNSMRLNPDPNLSAVLSAQMKERRGERKEAAQLNKTLAYLEKQAATGDPRAVVALDYAKGTGDIGGALKIATTAADDDRTALIKNFEFAKSQGFEGSFQDFIKSGGGGGTVVNVGGEGVKLTPFQKKRDETFAEQMIDWQSTGAIDASRQVAQISSVMKQFEAGKPLTGPVFAALDKVGLSSIFMPDARNAKDTVEQVVQRSLRETLGGQFAEREGERLIQRAYNPALPPEANLARLKGLFETLSYADQVKREMIKYATENGTLVGYEGPKMPSASEIEAAMDSAYMPEAKSKPVEGDKIPDFSAMSDAELDAYINEMGKQ